MSNCLIVEFFERVNKKEKDFTAHQKQCLDAYRAMTFFRIHPNVDEYLAKYGQDQNAEEVVALWERFGGMTLARQAEFAREMLAECA